MRTILIAAMAFSTACSQVKTDDPVADGPRTTRPTTPAARPVDVVKPVPEVACPPVAVRSIDLINEYQKNHVGADGKYLDKKLLITGSVTHNGRTLSGKAFLGREGVAGPRIGEPCLFMLFDRSDESPIGKLRTGSDEQVTVEGICRGRVNDGIYRGVSGFEFHVRVESCKFIKSEPWKPK